MDGKTENTNERPNNDPTSERKCIVDGKRFRITRHFMGDKDLGRLLTEIAVNRANRDMNR